MVSKTNKSKNTDEYIIKMETITKNKKHKNWEAKRRRGWGIRLRKAELYYLMLKWESDEKQKTRNLKWYSLELEVGWWVGRKILLLTLNSYMVWNCLTYVCCFFLFKICFIEINLYTIPFTHLKCTIQCFQHIHRVVHPSQLSLQNILIISP